jgi:DNA-binding SARP family transcriptional activator
MSPELPLGRGTPPSEHAIRPFPQMFVVLGPLEVHADGRIVDIGPPKQRLLLATLLYNVNRAVSVGRLMEALWGDEPPRTARKNLQAYVGNLRKCLCAEAGAASIALDPAGYRITVPSGRLDVEQFEALARAGSHEVTRGALHAGAQKLRAALDLWRGSAFEEFEDSRQLQDAAAHLNARHVSVFESWAEAELALGNADSVVDRIVELAGQHRLRERLNLLQMTALHHCGRTGEALAVYDDLRRKLSHELGLEPSPLSLRTYQSMLDSRPEVTVTEQPAHGLGALLPHDTPDFVGRSEQLARIEAAMVGPSAIRRILVTGPVGIGKTALAVRAAHRLSDSFCDGQIFVRMREADGTSRDHASLLAELWHTAGIPGSRPADLEVAVAIWHGHLAQRLILLVLDDARDETQVRPFLPQGGDSGVILTSRSHMSALDSLNRVEVPPLTTAESIDLLERVSGSRSLGNAKVAAERIAIATGMVPLAARVIGSKMRSLRNLSPLDIAIWVETRTPFWQQSEHDADVHARLVAARRDLPSEVDQVLGHLGSLAFKRFTIEDAAAASNLSRTATLEMLEALVEHNIVLVTDGDGRQGPGYELPVLFSHYLRDLADTKTNLTGRVVA